STVAGDRDDVARRLHHFADGVVARVRDEEVTVRVHGHVGRGVQLGGGSGAAGAPVAGGAVTGDLDEFGCGLYHLADAVVARVLDEDVAAVFHGHRVGPPQLGGGRGPAVAAVAGGIVTGDRDDVARGLHHLADDVVARVRDEEITVGVHGQAGRRVQ